MASTFKNAIETNIGTSEIVVYTCPTGKSATVIGMNLANILSSNILANIKVEDSSATKTAHLVKNAPVSAGGSLVAFGSQQKLVLEAGDTVRVSSNTAASIDVIMAILELTV